MSEARPDRHGDDGLVDNAREIRQLLHKMIDRRSLLTVHVPGGAMLMLTAVLRLDGDSGRLLLDSSRDAEVNARALKYPQLRCSGQLDGIGVRFLVGPLRLTNLEGLPAFEADIPAALFYLQRRESYRMEIPLSAGLECVLPLSLPVASGAWAVASALTARVIDLSTGGVALRVPDDQQHHFAAGAFFPRATLVMPDAGDLILDINVRHLAEHRIGEQVWYQAGCRFVGHSEATKAIIQRCVMRLERELILRLRGIG